MTVASKNIESIRVRLSVCTFYRCTFDGPRNVVTLFKTRAPWQSSYIAFSSLYMTSRVGDRWKLRRGTELNSAQKRKTEGNSTVVQYCNFSQRYTEVTRPCQPSLSTRTPWLRCRLWAFHRCTCACSLWRGFARGRRSTADGTRSKPGDRSRTPLADCKTP